MPNHSPPPTAILIVRQGPYAGKRAVIKQARYAIGSDARCQLHPPNSGLAPLHATLHLHEGAYYIQDRGSSQGTFVNGHQVSTARLQPGDRLRIGNLDLEFQLRTQPSAPPAPRPAGTLKAAPTPDVTPRYPDSGPGYSIIPSKGAAPSLYADEDASAAETPMQPPTRKANNPWIGRLYVAALLLVGFLLLVVVLPDMAGTNTSAAPPPDFNSSSGATVLYFFADW